MGAAAALIYPATLALLTATFAEPWERATAIGIWSAVLGLAVAIGPVSGGLLLRHFPWSSVFCINVPVAAIALAAGTRLLPESRDSLPGRFDPLGALLSVAGAGLLVWTVIEAPRRAPAGRAFAQISIECGLDKPAPCRLHCRPRSALPVTLDQS